VNVLGLDTATPSSAVALARTDGWLREARDDVAPGARPQHAQRLLALAAELLAAAGIGWKAIERVAVGVGPGGYTGLRIGLASAHGIALAHGAQLVGVGTLRALAEPVRGRVAVAVLDARRGEAFVAAYHDGRELIAPCVCRPAELAGLLRPAGGDPLAVGDGALRFREFLEHGGVSVAPEDSDLHRVSAGAICRLAASASAAAAVPDYLRLADAELALSAKTR
jgi:tRNA threonylcarbamoyladenosine biosynthesis protein TsaB